MSSFLHSGDLGDIILSLPSVRALGGGKYYLCHRDFTKPMSNERYEAISALLRAQPYITGVEWHKGQKIKYDFTGFRKHYRRGPGQNLATMHARSINAQLTIDTKTPWLTAGDFFHHGRTIIARSSRWHSVRDDLSEQHLAHQDRWEKIWPEVLADHPDAIFIGLKEEHEAFCKKFQVNLEHVKTPDLLEVAKLIKGSSLFIGNQSSPMAVCEGLKHPSIQETHFKVTDVIFDNPACHYISGYREWTKIRAAKTFGIMLQVFDGDWDQAKGLAHLINDIESGPRMDVEIFLAGRFDLDRSKLSILASYFSPNFPKVHIIRAERRGTGWPAGCNALWLDAMTQVCARRREGLTQAEAVFTMEPDCLPLRRDWLNCLKRDWATAKSQGKLAAGHLCYNEEGKPTHLNGNLIISTGISRVEPKLLAGAPSTQPWDCYHGQLLLRIGQDASSIYQNKRRPEFSEADWMRVEKAGKRPAIWHGIRSLEGQQIARKHLVTSSQLAPA